MNRDAMLTALDEHDVWDFIVVGGGATGLGVAIDAASRGYSTLLLEQADFAKGTSGRSTKLVHGGVRYLQQGNVSLVIEALRERGLLLANAPHLVRNLSFVVPNYDWWEGPFYGIGLKMYDLLAGRQGLGRSRMLSRERTLQLLPTLEPEGLSGGVVYYDGQFDDARLAINLAQTAAEQGAILLNGFRVDALLHNADGEVSGVRATDAETGTEREFEGRVVVNATGVWADTLRRMDDPRAAEVMVPSQGVHIVLERDFLPGESAIMVPKTEDGRVLFAIPWLDRVVVGTTDTAVEEIPLEPLPREEEIDFLLHHAALYLDRDPTRDDILSVWAGLRPLVGGSGDGEAGTTSALSRDHSLLIAPSGLVTIAGGKWTTYRNMAEDTVDQAAVLAGLPERDCVTRSLNIHGFHSHADEFGELATYGADAPALRALVRDEPALGERIHPRHGILAAQVVWGAREEMARSVDDVLARRTRLLLLDARAALDAAPRVAALLAAELGRDEEWVSRQLSDFEAVARGYLPG
ncbi:MAG: glycerol-3-phosphate dehydrogenase/oxidase [Gemmatimonadetes bacterium]|nr:glycerol-3-phosphate dehydrogenase/oxidase [Gemmatimonadota bacterium]